MPINLKHKPTSKGYFGIGIYDPKTSMNVDALCRSAGIFEASFIFTIGRRVTNQASDVFKTIQSMPFFKYLTFDQFYDFITYSCMLIGIEIKEKCTPIESYTHYDRAIYLLGSEDYGLPNDIINRCYQLIHLPNGNFNVANAGSIVMYDRYLKNQLI